MTLRPQTFVVGGAALIVLAWASLFQVAQNEQAIRVEFGKIVGQDYAPGLHAKWPFVNQVRRFERRIITRSYRGETFLTSENKALNVDFYVKWRVLDAPQYFRATNGQEELAADRLGDIVKDGIKGVVALRTLEEIVVTERTAFTGDMLERANAIVNELGVELIDVRVQRIDLPEDVSDAVYSRMRESFRALANQLRGEGTAEKDRIQAEADRKRTELLATSQRDAQRLRGEGDGLAAEIQGRAYSRAPEFYEFYRTQQAYRNSFGRDRDVLVVTPDSDFFKYWESGGSR